MSYNSKGNSKINLFAVTMADIFEKCLDRAMIPRDDGIPSKGWPARLIRAMEKELSAEGRSVEFESAFEGYIRDRFRIVQHLVEEGKNYQRITLDQFHIKRLAKFAGIEDVEELDALWAKKQPAEAGHNGTHANVDVICACKPFPRFALIRIPDDHGRMNFYQDFCRFYGEKMTLTITRGTLQNITEFSMCDRPNAEWVKVTVSTDDRPLVLYFAEVNDLSQELKLRSPRRLLNLLGAI